MLRLFNNSSKRSSSSSRRPALMGPHRRRGRFWLLWQPYQAAVLLAGCLWCLSFVKISSSPSHNKVLNQTLKDLFMARAPSDRRADDRTVMERGDGVDVALEREWMPKENDSDNEEADDCLRVIVGIVTSANETQRRENWKILLRMHHLLEDWYHPLPVSELKCGLNFAFVALSEPGAYPDRLDNASMIHLATTAQAEMARTEKSVEWFRYALDHYPAAHFIAKMDSDTRIHRRQLEHELVRAMKSKADYVGRPECRDNDNENKCPSFYYASSGFYALSRRLATQMIRSHKQHGMLHPHDEAKNMGALLEKGGLERDCCQTTATGPVDDCTFSCHVLLVGDVHDQHLIDNSPNKTLLEQLHIHYTRQVAFQPNQGDTASRMLLQAMPRLVWAFWFGNPMQGGRLAAYHSLVANIGVPLHVLTLDNLPAFNNTFSPIHPLVGMQAYSEPKPAMSAVQTVDYLRTYFMHHFGGGYHDIKPRSTSWDASFDLFTDEDVWLYGIPECGYDCIGCELSYVMACGENRSMLGMTTIHGQPGPCCDDNVRFKRDGLVSNGAYIMRPGTLMSSMWNDMVESHMTAKMELALQHPAPYPRCCNPQLEPYPFRWAELHGEAFHPCQVVYKAHVRQGLPRWDGGNYRGEAGEDVYTG